MSDLPPTWRRAEVGEIAVSVRGVGYKKEVARLGAAAGSSLSCEPPIFLERLWISMT